MSAARPETAADWAALRARRWLVRAIGYAILLTAGCAWMTRNDVPFLPAFAWQTLAGFYFSALILFAIWLGFVVGDWVGKLNGVLGVIVGLVAGGATFMMVGMLSTELPLLGPPLERFVSLIE